MNALGAWHKHLLHTQQWDDFVYWVITKLTIMTNIWREVTDKWQQFCILSAFDMARNYQYIEIRSTIVSTVPQLICICRCNVKCVCMYLQNTHNYCQYHSPTHVSHKMLLSSRKDTCSSCTHCMCLHSDIVLHLQHTHACQCITCASGGHSSMLQFNMATNSQLLASQNIPT